MGASFQLPLLDEPKAIERLSLQVFLINKMTLYR
jgi:hypothetical protein